jgi:hypothetical protein
VLAAVLVGALAAVGAARLIEPSDPPVVPPIELRQEPTQTAEKPMDEGPQQRGSREDEGEAPSTSGGAPPPPQEADPAPAPPPVRAGDDDDDGDDDGDDGSDDAGESDD